MNKQSSSAVSAEGLHYEVDAKSLLDGVDLHVEQGQFVGLIGPNGAGKTMLLRAIAGVLSYNEGVVLLDGTEVKNGSPRDIARAMALVPQVAPYTQGFTALELVLMGRYPHLGRFQIEGGEDNRIARNAMRLTETEQFTDRTLDTLSGGERQRIFVSRALAQQPCVLLLDEPTSNLDILHQLKVISLVRKMVDDGLTAIAAIHDLQMAARYCDRLVLMKDGRILAKGSPEEVLTPETIQASFGVKAAVYRDPVAGSLALSLLDPVEEQPDSSASNGVPTPLSPEQDTRRAIGIGGEQ